MRGFLCHGIDTSPDAIERLRTLVAEIETYRSIALTGEAATSPDWHPGRTFDLVFHSGVIHQVLDADERAAFHRRAVELSRRFVVAIASSSLVGRHDPAGFVPGASVGELTAGDVPVVPYTPAMFTAELTAAGLVHVRVLPVNIGGQWPRGLRLLAQALPRAGALNRWAAALLAIGRVRG
jgi:hypothetical protein